MNNPLEGKFYKYKMVKIGTGATARRVAQKTYWHAQLTENSIKVWPLSPKGEPFSRPEELSTAEFSGAFVPAMEYPIKKEILTVEDIRLFTVMFEIYAQQGAESNAELFLNDILALPEEMIADLGVFFTKIGLILRKGRCYKEALLAYKKAMEIVPNSASLYFNIGRVYFDMKEYEETIANLLIALRLTNDTGPIIRFLEYMHQHNLIPEQCIEKVYPVLNLVV